MSLRSLSSLSRARGVAHARSLPAVFCPHPWRDHGIGSSASVPSPASTGVVSSALHMTTPSITINSSTSSLLTSQGKDNSFYHLRDYYPHAPLHTSASPVLSASSAATPASGQEGGSGKEEQNWIMRTFGPDSCEGDPDKINRWSMLIPAFGTHLAIGSPWAWSVISDVLSREVGIVAAAADDWTMAQVTIPLSIVFALQGIAAGAAGAWQQKVGPRIAMGFAGLCFGVGNVLAGAAISMHSLPLLYLSYGVLAGTGVGVGYTPPVQALIQWFPDRRGLASGMTLAGFGCGALVLAPAFNHLCQTFARMPTFLGGPSAVATTTTDDGRLMADVAGTMTEVVLATKQDLAKLLYSGLEEGYYIVGSGDSGAATALTICGAGYLALMLGSAAAIRRPPAGYIPAGWTPPNEDASGVQQRSVHFDTILSVPQFRALMATFFCVATGGMGLFAVAKPMMTEVFSGALPLIVTSSFASAYVLALSAGNLGGRIGWSAFSDAFGRRTTFQVFTLASVPMYLSVPYLAQAVVNDGSAMGMYTFIGTTVAAISIMGGVYAVLPAYEADLFGSKYVGANHGRMLLASSAAALTGPALIVQLRNFSERSAIDKLLQAVDSTKFEATFGVPISAADQLIQAKTLTISKLMALAPEGYVDPSPFVYDSTMYTMAGLMACAAVAHHFVKKPAEKYLEVSGKDITDK